MDFADVVTTQGSLRETIGAPMPRALRKEIARLDEHCRALIAASPFVLVGSGDGAGNLDVSPKGDRPGFVQVLDERTLAIPDRPGNRRADTFTNVLRNAGVGLLFLIPGKLETLRVNGRARIVRDPPLLGRMAVEGKTPALALVVTVEQAFIHCGKCMLRSGIWDPASWADVSGLPSQAECLVSHAALAEPLEEVEASIEESRRTRLY